MRLRITLLTIAGLVLTQGVLAGQDIMVSDAWVREAPPNATVLAGFMVIKNHSGKKRSLVKVSSSGFGKAELHRTVHKDGMAKMMHQKIIDIPAKGSVAFKPGDYHIMLMKPKKNYKAGDHIKIKLGFSDGSEMTVKYTVRKGMGMKDDGHMMDHDKGHMMDHNNHDMGKMKH